VSPQGQGLDHQDEGQGHVTVENQCARPDCLALRTGHGQGQGLRLQLTSRPYTIEVAYMTYV